ncbi:hypothetical protein ABN09_07840, partial [Morganella morganii]
MRITASVLHLIFVKTTILFMRLLTFLLSSSFCLSGYAAGGSLNGYYNCEISSASYQRKQGAMRDFYFPDKQR